MSDNTLVNTHQQFSIQRRITTEVSQKLFNLDWDHVAHIAHEHTMSVQKWLSSRSPLYNGTISIFERQGFQRTRRLGKNHWVVTKVIDASS